MRHPMGFAYAALCIVFVFLSGCAVRDRTDIAPPAETYTQFSPIGVPAEVRVFADFDDIDRSEIVRELRDGLTRRHPTDGVNLLALSGGGPDGAYGAGVLNGWSQTGQRPEFDVVTGISTGAIIAPFAFLGPEYDAALKRFFTNTNTRRVARERVLPALIGGGSLARSTPLQEAIARELTDDVLRAVAVEHDKGRRIIVGTTHFDAERPMVWDLGYIASIGTPEAFDLARRVILASASIPVVFNPVSIPVTNGIERREELHVDGALTQQVFTYPVSFDMRAVLSDLGLSGRKNTIWLIYNKRLEPRYQAQDTRLLGMIDRTMTTMLRTQGLSDVSHIISLAQRDGLGVNGLAVPVDFQVPRREGFDPVYMTELFNRGVRDGASGEAWYRDLQDEFTPR